MSCQKDETPKIKYSTTLSAPKKEAVAQGVSAPDDFRDFKKKDEEEGCTDEEELEKKLLEAKKAFKLQGETDEDCTVQ